MNETEFLKIEWITQKYNGILEINTKKCLNAITLNKVLLELQKQDYELVKMFNGCIRAFKK